MEKVDVVIVGAGQAGLSVSGVLARSGIEHVVLERDRVAQTWRDRWDSFCLVTPNWAIRLPDGEYRGSDPDGYLSKQGIVAFLEDYARGIGSPVRERTEVEGVESRDNGFVVLTSYGPISTRNVVACSGAYQRPTQLAGIDTLPKDLLSIDVTEYRSPSELPDGDVLVVGSGQTGCQLAEELHEAGRRVVLSCGKAPWTPRRIGGRDIVWWATETGYLSQPVAALPDPRARLWANILATGHDGGHDLHYRSLRGMGVTLVGHLRSIDGNSARFANDLGESVAWGDERYLQFRELVRGLVRDRGLDEVDLPDPEPFDPAAPQDLSLSGFGSVIITSGFRPDYGSWIPWADAFDDIGFPIQTDGASSIVPGLFFAGVHFLRTRKSSILLGIGEDAAVVGARVAERLGRS